MVGGELGIDCAGFGLEIGDAGGLASMVVVEQVIALHKLLYF